MTWIIILMILAFVLGRVSKKDDSTYGSRKVRRVK